jgi:Lysophospholipase L1 and related esterases
MRRTRMAKRKRKIKSKTTLILIIIIILFNKSVCVDLKTSDKVGTVASKTLEENETVKSQLNNINLSKDIYSEYYINKVTSFMASDSGKGKIVFLGDSLTDICDWSELLNNNDIINRGISLDTTDGVLNRLSEVTRLNPKKVFIMIGINDIGKGRGTRSIIYNYKKILDFIKENSKSTTIYVQSLLPINKDILKTTTKNEEIINLNKELAKLCDSYGVKYIDLYPLFVVDNNKLNPEYTVGGLHVNGKGYLVWKRAIEQYCN